MRLLARATVAGAVLLICLNHSWLLPAQEVRPQKWEFGIAARARGGPCSGVMGTFPVPSEWPEQSVKVVSESLSPGVRHKLRSLDSLSQVVIEVAQVAAGNDAECFLTYEIVKRPQQPPTNAQQLVIPEDPPREVKRWLNSGPLIESSHSKIRTLARELTEGHERAWDQVQAILEGVRQRVQYERSKDKTKGAIGSLRAGKADREDITATFLALCRAVKIPARTVWSMDYCYAEFYLQELSAVTDGELADAAEKPKKGGKAMPPKGNWYPCVVHDRVELGVCTDPRPILEKGENFKVPEEKPLQRFVTEHLTMKSAVKPSIECRRKRVD